MLSEQKIKDRKAKDEWKALKEEESNRNPYKYNSMAKRIMNITYPLHEIITNKEIYEFIKTNRDLNRINKFISKEPIFRFRRNYYDYIFDALNIEGGKINGFKNIKKIIKNNKLYNKKILIIIRSVLKPQYKYEHKFCKKLSSEIIHIIYIHTSINIKNKIYHLLQSCTNNEYCTTYEKKSYNRLCTTPIIEALKLNPIHYTCEIDDLLVYYSALLNKNASIVAKTEDYTKIITETNIHAIKLLMNIPVTYYTTEYKNYHIKSLNLFTDFLKKYKREPYNKSK